jgi:hypothetical protein
MRLAWAKLAQAAMAAALKTKLFMIFLSTLGETLPAAVLPASCLGCVETERRRSHACNVRARGVYRSMQKLQAKGLQNRQKKAVSPFLGPARSAFGSWWRSSALRGAYAASL